MEVWKQGIDIVNEELQVAMYCVKWCVESIKERGVPSISFDVPGGDETSITLNALSALNLPTRWCGLRLEHYKLPDGTLRGLEVHAIGDGMCVECANIYE